MATGTLSPDAKQTFLDTNGNPLVSGKLFTYIAGTTTAVATYTDVGLTVANANPIILDTAGRCVIFLSPGGSYKYVLQDSTGAAVWTQDNISTVPGSAGNLDITGTAGEALTAGQAVYLSDGSGGKTTGQWFKGDSTNTYSSTLPEVGMVPSSIALGASGTIRLLGSATGLTTTIGTTYYIGTAGAITSTAPGNARALGVADTTSTIVLKDIPAPSVIADNGINDFRLTLTTGTPVTSTDVTAATTVFCTPAGKGNRIALFNSSGVATVYSSAEFSIAVPATTSQMYDVFAFASGTTPTLELLAWTNDTTRATAIVLTTTGTYTKSGDLTRRYLGSFRTTTVSGQTEDSKALRYVWNYYNRVTRYMQVVDTTDSWSYSTATWRQARATATNQLAFIVGVADVTLDAKVVASSLNTAGGNACIVSIGLDSTSTPTAGMMNGNMAEQVANTPVGVMATLTTMPAVGFHFAAWLELTSGGTGTFQGDNGGTQIQSGISGTIQG